ncbi:g8626 [Coccomyxa elongata]
MSEKGARQRRFRQKQKDHQQATQRHLQELSERVSTLELEREQLRGALGTACGDVPGRKPSSSTPELLDQQEVALNLCFGKASVQLQLTRGNCRALTADAVADIWKDLVHEAISFMWALVDHNPSMLNKLVTINIEDGNKLHSPDSDPRDWPAILAALHLEEGQAEQLLVTRRTVLRELGALFAEREQMLARLQGMQDVEERSEGAAIHFTEAARLMEQLRANVHALHVLPLLPPLLHLHRGAHTGVGGTLSRGVPPHGAGHARAADLPRPPER